VDKTGVVTVLAIGESGEMCSSSFSRLEQRGCECYFAKSQTELASLLESMQFDIVLSARTLQGTGTGGLGGLLWGGRSSLFYIARVGDDCWWLPVLRRGRECFGSPALRTNEFMNALDDVIREIRGEDQARWNTAVENTSREARATPC
jgi:hypothetical protein